jgi:hypothetical protein
MHEIYAGAETVVIWLGDASADSDVAIAFMWEVYQRLASKGQFSGDSVRSGQYLEADFQDGIEEFLGPESDDEWEAVAQLLSRDWWQRAWVVQELVVAKDAICYCGKTSVAWCVICALIEAIGNGMLMTIAKPSHHFSISGAFDRAWGISYLRSQFTDRGHIDLWNLLHRNRRQDCADPRDKVYSILGMTHQEIRRTLRPDYTRSASQVFTMAVVSDIKDARDLEVLHLVDHGGIPPSETLPSWVADFQKAVQTWRFTKFDPEFKSYKSSSITFSEDLRILNTDGFLIDTVVETRVQQTDVAFGPLLPYYDKWNYHDKWAWDIEQMATKLLNEGGIRTSKLRERSKTPKDVRRSVERAIYDVMIAGQLSTLSDWVQHDVRYLDEDGSNTIATTRPVNKRNGDSQPFDQTGTHEPAPQSSNGDVSKPIGWENMLFQAMNQTLGRTLILSTKRYLGLASKATEPGDHIFVLSGLLEPAILRLQEGGTYKFVGIAYVHGIMKGEAWKDLERELFRQQRVSIQ